MWERWNQSTHIFEKSTDNGASWTPMPIAYSSIEGGPPPVTLPPFIAFTNVKNVFNVGEQYIDGNNASPNGFSGIALRNLAEPADSRLFRIILVGPNLYLQSTNDAETTQAGSVIINRDGTITHTGNLNTGAKITAGTDIQSGAAMIAATGVYPGRIDGGGAQQTSWALNSHGSYGLYTGTGLFVASVVWAEGGLRQGLDPPNGSGTYVWFIESSNHIRAAGGLYDYSRGVPIGTWAHGNPASYVHGQMSGVSGTMSWTYVGKTMFLDCYFGGYFGGGYIVNCTIPEGILPAVDIRIPVLMYHDEKPWGQGFAIFTAGQYYFTLYNEGTINMSPSSVMYWAFNIAIPMQ